MAAAFRLNAEREAVVLAEADAAEALISRWWLRPTPAGSVDRVGQRFDTR